MAEFLSLLIILKHIQMHLFFAWRETAQRKLQPLKVEGMKKAIRSYKLKFKVSNNRRAIFVIQYIESS